MSEAMIEVNKENYEDEVLKADTPVVVDFWGPRCTSCLALMPEVEKMAEEYAGKIKFCSLNATKNRRLCINLKVMALPTFLFYKDGEVIDKLTGEEATKDKIVARLKSFLLR